MKELECEGSLTYSGLIEAIDEMDHDLLDERACVWPPEGCPSHEEQGITGIAFLPDRVGTPVLLTGKKPEIPGMPVLIDQKPKSHSYRIIRAVLNQLTDMQKRLTAVVWPPEACPETKMVPITGIDKRPDMKGRPVFSTGKKPRA